MKFENEKGEDKVNAYINVSTAIIFLMILLINYCTASILLALDISVLTNIIAGIFIVSIILVIHFLECFLDDKEVSIVDKSEHNDNAVKE